MDIQPLSGINGRDEDRRRPSLRSAPRSGRPPFLSGLFVGLLMGLLAGLFAAGPAVATNGLEMIGIGARSSAMGGASSALADDAIALIDNPAGIARLGRRHLDVSFSIATPLMNHDNPLNDARAHRDTVDAFYGFYPMPLVAYAQPVHGWPELSWGAGLFVPGGLGADYTLNHELWPDGASYHSKLIFSKFVTAVGLKLTDRLSLGAGFHVGFGWMDIWQPFAIGPDFAEGSTGGSASELIAPTYGEVFQRMGYDEVNCLFTMKQANSLGFGANVGVLYDLSDQVTLGASYTSPMPLRWKARATMDMTDQYLQASRQFGMPLDLAFVAFGLSPEDGMISRTDVEFSLDWPQRVNVGVAYRPSSRLLFAVDFAWINWAETMKSFIMEFSSISNPNHNKMIGLDACARGMPLNWKDQYVVAFGIACEVGRETTLRAGYNYGENPVPGNTATPTFAAIVEHHLTLGVGKIWGRMELNAAFEYALGNTLETGESLVAAEFDGSRNELTEFIFHFALTWRGFGK